MTDKKDKVKKDTFIDRLKRRAIERRTKKKEPVEIKGFVRAIPVIMIAAALFLTLCFITAETGAFGRFISNLLMGLFSYMAYTIPAFIVFHAIFFYSDIKEHKLGIKVIFSFIALVMLSMLAYIIPNISSELVFNVKDYYNNGKNSVGGGFIGSVFAFALAKIIGKVGLLIVIALAVALYILYLSSGSGSGISRFFLRKIAKIANYFADIEERKQEKKKTKREEKLVRQRAVDDKKNADFYNDEYFNADNGVSRLEIPELGILETKTGTAGSPFLRETVIKEDDTVAEESVIDEATEDKKRFTDIEIEADPIFVRTETPSEGFRSDDIVYEEVKAPTSADESDDVPSVSKEEAKTAADFGIDDSADAIFTSSFDPFDLAMNEKRANKPSSKVKEMPKESKGFSEFISELTPEQAEQKRRLEEFERNRRAAIERRAAREAEEAALVKASIEKENARIVAEREAKAESAIKETVSTPAAESTAPAIDSAKQAEEERAREQARLASLVSGVSPSADKTETAPATHTATGSSAPVSEEKRHSVASIVSDYESTYGSIVRPSVSDKYRFVGATAPEPRRAYSSGETASEVRISPESSRAAASVAPSYSTPTVLPYTDKETNPAPATSSYSAPAASVPSATPVAPTHTAPSAPAYTIPVAPVHTTPTAPEYTAPKAHTESARSTVADTAYVSPAPTYSTGDIHDAPSADMAREIPSVQKYVAEASETTGETISVAIPDKEMRKADPEHIQESVSKFGTGIEFEETDYIDADIKPTTSTEFNFDEKYDSGDEDDLVDATPSDEATLEVSRTMLDSTLDASSDLRKSGLEFTYDEDDEDIEEEEFSEDELEPEEIVEKKEIPEDERNPEIYAQRQMFDVFRNVDSTKTEEIENESVADEDELKPISVESAYGEESEEAEDEDDTPPFDDYTEEEYEEPIIPQPKKEEKKKPALPDYSNYKFPPLELLKKSEEEDWDSINKEIQYGGEQLINTLDSFNIKATIRGMEHGPRITRYSIVPAKGVRVNQIEKLADDIALALAAESIRIEAPIPGKSAVGVEVPNKVPSLVSLRDLLEADEFQSETSKTCVCIGKSVEGSLVYGDIGSMPHVLIAGATGMGKSVCINSLITSMLYKARPDEVKFIMIDPKKVEFAPYNGIPHLLVPVVTEPKQAAGALMWAVDEMNKRYEIIEKLCVKSIDSYNKKVSENPELGAPMSKIIIFIDELNDLMVQVRDPVENLIMLIAQKARAAGIHLVIGTQRPSVDVITGVIKANIPSRIACKVSSGIDSRTILEQTGAEKLIGKGDMLFAPSGKAPKRVQGAFVSETETENIVDFIKAQFKDAHYDEQALEDMRRAAQKCDKSKSGDSMDDDYDEDNAGMGFLQDQKFLNAVELAIRNGSVATSFLQRKLKIGYGKAAQYIDIMEEQGIVGEKNGAKAREVKMTMEEWREMLNRRLDD
ncbi:MAG: DNA translocase FtsK 4TM domain-containing protein [Clostridia bacterium]|nr:DNA translocase FtsK 4TM domain-containing protein [Clostridia bacterium]